MLTSETPDKMDPKQTSTTIPSSKKVANGSFSKLVNLTHDQICFRILPTMGSFSYGYFSVHIMNASWFKSVFHSHDIVVANSLWFNAHIGIGLYMYGSYHLQQAPVNRRILYSVFGSFLFNFGSVLFWGTCRSLLPRKPGLRVLFGLVSGFVLLYVGKEYVDYVDKRMKGTLSS